MKIIALFVFFSFISFNAQVKENDNGLVTEGVTSNASILSKDPLKAALYSAVLPGLGQTYNKQYWKIPIVWGVIGTGAGFALYYNRQYRRYRDGYLASLNGDPTGFPADLTTEILAQAQDDQRRDRDYAIVITTLLYAMNILDALVSAHLSEMKKDKDLAIHPIIIKEPLGKTATYGIGFQLNF